MQRTSADGQPARSVGSPRAPQGIVALGLTASFLAVLTGIALGGTPAESSPRREPPAIGASESNRNAGSVSRSRSPSRLVGQLLMGRMTGPTPSLELLGRIRRGELGGVILFADNITTDARTKATIGRLQAVAREGGNPPLLIATDQEGGDVARFPSAPPGLSARDLARTGDPRISLGAGRDTGRFLRRIGVNVNLAPVLDVPATADNFLGERAFGMHPRVVSSFGKAFVRGLQAEGVAATAKHFPGLGTAGANTDYARVVIASTERTLRWRYRPFVHAIRGGVRLVMVANASYPSLDPSQRPAALSRPIVTDLLRRKLGFQGVVITDAFTAPGLAMYRDPPVLAIGAGVDILLYATHEADSATAYRTLMRAVRSGDLSRADLEAANLRITALKRWLERER